MAMAGKIPQIEESRLRRAVDLAAYAAALRLKAYLMNVTDELGITDRGIYKNSFRVVKGPNGPLVENNSPHAPMVELGARPHKVSREGVEAIAAWVRRKLGVKDSDEALGIAYAISKKIEQHGMEGRYVMRDALPHAKRFFDEELFRLLTGQGPAVDLKKIMEADDE